MCKFYNATLFKFIYLSVLSISIIATPGFSQSLDMTFGNGGKVVTLINDSSTANSVIIQSDGKIIIGGTSTLVGEDYFTLVRYNVDGSIDNTFGSGGRVINNFGGRSQIFSIALQPDGKIVAGGTSADTIKRISDFTIVRYQINGTIDSLFGINGVVKTEMSGIVAQISKLLIKSDGKILAAGTVGLKTFENIPALAQYNTNGSIDSLFGENGKVDRYIGNIETLTDIALTNGKIIATGKPKSFGNSDFALLRFFQNGNLDNMFGTNGVILTDFNNSDDVSYALSLQLDSSIVLAGYSYKNPTTTRIALAKFHANGSSDSSFGIDGKVVTSTDSINSTATNIIADPDGNLVVSGYTFGMNMSDFALGKYFSNGKLDSTFGNHGIVTTDFAGFPDISYASALQADGKIILAGQAGNNTKYSIALARYTMNVLPLKLLSFSAIEDGKNNVLQWETAQEVNVNRFEIERSPDGREYTTIGKMIAGLSKYNFTDVKPFTGINYYRLKMIDRDGKFEYSMVTSVINSGRFFVNIYPLPAKDKLYIQVQSDKAEKAEISVTDISGKILTTNFVSLSAGVNNSSINVQSLSKGVYFLKVATSQATETRKIVIGH